MQTKSEDKLAVLRQTEKGLRERLATVQARAVAGSKAQGYVSWATEHLNQASDWLQLNHALELVEGIESEIAWASDFIVRAELCDPDRVLPFQEDLR